MSCLINAGLVKRRKGRYFLTALGRVIYSARVNFEAEIESALNNYWKLKAVDSLEIKRQDRNEIISVIIDNEEIKSILMKEDKPRSSTQAVIKNQDTLLLN